jgi:hypothetical protein
VNVRCDRHAHAPAGWRCDGCGAALCPRCVGRKHTGGTSFDLCASCGGFARQLMVSRGEADPFSAGQLLRAFGWPLQPAGLLTLLATAAVLTLFGYLGATGIGRGVTLAFLFQIVRYTALGHDDFGLNHEFRGLYEDVVSPARRLAVALAWIWLPLLAWQLATKAPEPSLYDQQKAATARALRPGGPGLMVRGMKVVRSGQGTFEVVERDAPAPPPSPEQLARGERGGEAEAPGAEPAAPPAGEPAAAAEQTAAEPSTDPAAADPQAPEASAEAAPPPRRSPLQSPLVPLVLVLLGVLVAPISILASSLETPLWSAANPLVLLGHAARLGGDYLLLLAFCVAETLLLWQLSLRAPLLLAALPLSRLLVNLLVLYLAFVIFRGIGLLVRARGADLGYGGASAYLVPVLGATEPAFALEAGQTFSPQAGADGGRGPAVVDEVTEPPPRPTPAPIELDLEDAPLGPLELVADQPGATAAEPQPELVPDLPPARHHDQRPSERLDREELVRRDQRPSGRFQQRAEPPAPQTPAMQLAELLARRDLEACVALLEQSPKELPAMLASARSWHELAQVALAAERPRQAALALRRCLDAEPEGVLAPQAWLQAARIYDEKLGDRPTSNRLLQELARRFPDTEQGRFASRRLATLSQPGR